MAPRNKGILFVLSLVSAIFVFAFWKVFEFLNLRIADPNYDDPAILLWTIWVFISLGLLYVLGSRLGPKIFT